MLKVDMWEFLADYIDDNRLKDGEEIRVYLHGRDICKVKVERDDDGLDFKLINIRC
jgi:hypothetical protein